MKNLTQIQTFLEVARLGSFAKAARRLSLPRTTITARIKALEGRLNVRLFHRTTRSVSLTDEGRQYFSSCENAVDVLLQAEDELTSVIKPAGHIRLSVPIDFPQNTLVQLLSKFREDYPAISFIVNVSDAVVDLVRDNFDLALRGRDPGTPGLISRKIMSGKMAFFGSAKYHTETGKQTVNFDDFPLLDPAHVLNMAAIGTSVHPPIQTDNFLLAKSIALSSNCIALLPENLCVEEINAGVLLKLDGPTRAPELPLYLVMPSRAYIPARIRSFIDFLASQSDI